MFKSKLSTFCFGLLIFSIFFEAGCVPIPLTLKNTSIVWSGTNERIEERSKQGYFPILVSPEGSGRSFHGDVHISYFLVNQQSKKTVELPFLRFNSKGNYDSWNWFKMIDGSSDWMAIRIIDIQAQIHVTAEIAVFDSNSLKHKHTFNFQCFPYPMNLWKIDGIWDYVRFDSNSKSITYYESRDGTQRYKLLEDVEESLDNKAIK